jgi:hypothetical protein
VSSGSSEAGDPGVPGELGAAELSLGPLVPVRDLGLRELRCGEHAFTSFWDLGPNRPTGRAVEPGGPGSRCMAWSMAADLPL